MSTTPAEAILAQEQGATMRTAGAKKEVEAEFGVGAKQGTLILTNRRLIFVCTNDRGEDLPIGFFGRHLLVYSEVEDLSKIPDRAPNIFIPLEAATVQGHRGELGRPSLTVSWTDKGRIRSSVFTETMVGRRKKNLNDWADVIDGIKKGTQKLVELPPPPPTETLEGKIMHVLADMQEKGVLEIEEDVESEYKVDLEPDDVEDSCDRLASQRLLVRVPDSSGDTFYRRASPLGDEELSS
jgi:hypothetical protein